MQCAVVWCGVVWSSEQHALCMDTYMNCCDMSGDALLTSNFPLNPPLCLAHLHPYPLFLPRPSLASLSAALSTRLCECASSRNSTKCDTLSLLSHNYITHCVCRFYHIRTTLHVCSWIQHLSTFIVHVVCQ